MENLWGSLSAARVVATPTRRADAGPETKSSQQRLQSISVLFPETLAVPTLGAALKAKPLNKQVLAGAQAKAKAMQQAHMLLSSDEIAAIILYTQESEHAEDSLYFQLNVALRQPKGRIEAVTPWVGYIWLLLHALSKLPPSPTVLVFRGCVGTPNDLGLDLTPGSTFCWAGFSSGTLTAGVMHSFLGDVGARVLWHVQLVPPSGARSIGSFSMHATEDEVLLPPNTEFEVLSSYASADGLVIVQCKQIESEDP